MAEHDSWKKEKDLKNTRKLVAEFKKKINTKVRRQEKFYLAEEKDFRRVELPGKYIAKMLYRQDDEKFENKYLKKLEKLEKIEKKR